MLMLADHENRPPFSRSALRTDRPFSSPDLLSNVWWADKPLSKVLRMRTTLTVTLLGLITLIEVTKPHSSTEKSTLGVSLSLLIFVFGAFEGMHRHDTQHVRISVPISAAALQRSRVHVFWLFYARFSLCVFSIRTTSVREQSCLCDTQGLFSLVSRDSCDTHQLHALTIQGGLERVRDPRVKSSLFVKMPRSSSGSTTTIRRRLKGIKQCQESRTMSSQRHV